MHPILLLLLLALGGCATRPAAPVRSGQQVALAAHRFIGTPYRYGGASPRGFDCSGLVYYVHRQLGFAIPRTARAQWRRARRVDDGDRLPGDLVFFRLPSKSWHVGIYVGNGRFIHAPSRGRRVRTSTLTGYWRRHYLGSGRVWNQRIAPSHKHGS